MALCRRLAKGTLGVPSALARSLQSGDGDLRVRRLDGEPRERAKQRREDGSFGHCYPSMNTFSKKEQQRAYHLCKVSGKRMDASRTVIPVLSHVLLTKKR